MLRPSAALEALLFAHGEPVEKRELEKMLGVDSEALSAAVVQLRGDLEGRGLVVLENGEHIELRTAPEASELVMKLRERDLARDLGKAPLEVLAVVAYRGGATRSEVDWVRGVNSTASLRTLLMRGLVNAKEDPSDKRRMRYEITTDALAHLGVTRREDLPRYNELSLATAALEREMPKSESGA